MSFLFHDQTNLEEDKVKGDCHYSKDDGKETDIDSIRVREVVAVDKDSVDIGRKEEERFDGGYCGIESGHFHLVLLDVEGTHPEDEKVVEDVLEAMHFGELLTGVECRG